jgi:hypothetical protein
MVQVSNGFTNPLQFTQLTPLHSVDLANNNVITEGGMNQALVPGDIVTIVPIVATMPNQASLGGAPGAYFANYRYAFVAGQSPSVLLSALGNTRWTVGYLNLVLQAVIGAEWDTSVHLVQAGNPLWSDYIRVFGDPPDSAINLPAYAEGSSSALSGSTLVTGVVGQTIYIRGWELDVEGAAFFLALRDSTIAAPNGRFAVMNRLGDQQMAGLRTPLSSGAGVVIDSVASANTGRVVLHYSQVPNTWSRSSRVGFYNGGITFDRGQTLQVVANGTVPTGVTCFMSFGVYLNDS